ncbi:MAG: hypothetical protein Q7U07_04960 [Gammaproteobacteria bacterium]|nr:hypothetical protein [Gammaproteobacteria bacterium]
MNRFLRAGAVLLSLTFPLVTQAVAGVAAPCPAETANSAVPGCTSVEGGGTAVQQSQEVLRGFIEQQQTQPPDEQGFGAEIKQKRQILFLMGSVLLIGIFTTLSLGIAMALYNKPVFVAHMVFAGITATLALIHAVTAMVWFYPF